MGSDREVMIFDEPLWQCDVTGDWPFAINHTQWRSHSQHASDFIHLLFISDDSGKYHMRALKRVHTTDVSGSYEAKNRLERNTAILEHQS